MTKFLRLRIAAYEMFFNYISPASVKSPADKNLISNINLAI